MENSDCTFSDTSCSAGSPEDSYFMTTFSDNDVNGTTIPMRSSYNEGRYPRVKTKKYAFVATAQSKAVLSEDRSLTFQTTPDIDSNDVTDDTFQSQEAIAESVTEGENPYVTISRAMAKAASAAAEAAMHSFRDPSATCDNLRHDDVASQPLQLVLTATCTLRADSTTLLNYAVNSQSLASSCHSIADSPL
jgi:hypothetical protein